MIAFYIKFLVRSVGNFTAKIHISDRFVNLILIPIIENAAEHITIIIIIFRNKLNFAIEIVLGSGV
jgi:Ca2+:H+ antiporter